jgi:hypothetical protein
MLTRTLPFKIVQNPGVTIVLFEEFNNWRQVFTDGRPLPVDPQPAWLGYSVGRWEGDTFVVESSGFNDKAWLDAGGTPHSEALSTVERLRRLDFGHMEAEFTFDDPRAFTSRWSANRFELLPDTDLPNTTATTSGREGSRPRRDAAAALCRNRRGRVLAHANALSFRAGR